ncbi:hypothetical protein BJK06_04070 [Curtobacterium sp. BH-2-1-1]|uniref:DUF4190 domain-containing protein n=1 Tax=Curtobacterium sp. BH-2-1-1 TaxID=1905847 RepID=UPI00089E0155|nr:DUF4190 domain-containing protein [Curtobacterium sp. BH-2-1-1]AOX65049.1 hypothetical protein BJK06_04070 [Curtobacterium sp. BH-2-1-1]
MTDIAPGAHVPATRPDAAPTAGAPTEVAPLSLIAVVAIALAFVAPIGGVVVGFIARREVRRTGERGDGLAFAAVLIGATLTLVTVVLPAAVAASGFLGLGVPFGVGLGLPFGAGS